MKPIKFELTHSLGIMPERATKGSVGYDFFSPYTTIINPNERVVIDTGVKCSFPDTMWLGVYGRSSFAKKGLINPLGVGIVDSDYYDTGNSIGVALWNVTDKPIQITSGTAIGQGVFHQVNLADDIITTERTGGFGSTDETDTITFKGKKYKTQRATYYMGEESYNGVIIPYVSTEFSPSNKGNYTHTFISDNVYRSFHDGDDPNYQFRCWWVHENDNDLTIQ